MDLKNCLQHKHFQHGDFDVKDGEASSGLKVDAIIVKMEQNITGYDIAKELGVDYKIVLTF